MHLSALVIAALTGALVQSGSPGAKPWIHRVNVADDTVWFEGELPYDGVEVRYCFARRSGEWCRRPRRGLGETLPSRAPRRRSDSVVLAPDLTLVCRPPFDRTGECEAFAVRVTSDTNVLALVPRASPHTLAMLQKAARLETDQPPAMSEFISAWATSNDAVWFGLGGGFPEGDGAYGGLLRFDRTRRTVETIVHAGLADATVTGLAIDGDTLWVGTMHPAEYGPVGSTGVLCQNLRTGRWTTLDSAGARLPDKVINALAARDGSLYVATQDGLAAFDTRTSRWSVVYFRRTAKSGATEYTLVDARPSD